ncbi:MAG: hypothetical protein GY705_22115 [Bacteroidetes bacterium]|nr:hypothetical protein [Bacteroidota bacterium]
MLDVIIFMNGWLGWWKITDNDTLCLSTEERYAVASILCWISDRMKTYLGHPCEQAEIKNSLRKDYSPRHVPDDIIAIKEIPYTISGKKLEAPVKKILMGMPIEKAANIGAVKNPRALEFFVKFSKTIQ